MIATLVACLAGTFAHAAAANPEWLDGEWVFHPRHLITDTSGPAWLETDTAGTLYFHAPLKVRLDGQWESLSGESPAGATFLAFNRNDYWTGGGDGLVHYRDGQARSFDTANSCLKGDRFFILGSDPIGRLIVNQWHSNGADLPTVDAIRFGGNACEDLFQDSATHARFGVGAYHADSAGREYVSTADRQDPPSCGPFLRLAQDRLDTLAEDLCLYSILSMDSAILVQGKSGWYTFKEETSRVGTLPAYRSSIQGKAITAMTGMLLDSKGVLWMGMEDERLFAIRTGPSATGSETDTVVFLPGASGFPDGYPLDLAEDDHGNIWIAFSGGQFSVFARHKESLPVRPTPVRPYSTSPALSRFDAMGRRASNRASPPFHTTPRRVLFTAHSTP